jgi:PPOX class probable F420-dependent enzyme
MSSPTPVERSVALERLSLARVGRFATASADGRPHVVPLCFAVLGGAAYSVVDEKPKTTRTGLRRLRNLAANPRASLLADHYAEDWTSLWFVMVEGEASLVTDAGEYAVALEALRLKYVQLRSMDLGPATHPMIRLRLDRVVAWSGGG